jgi:hypothetical protein
MLCKEEKAKDKTDLKCYHTTNHNPNYAQTTNTFWYCMWKGWPLCWLTLLQEKSTMCLELSNYIKRNQHSSLCTVVAWYKLFNWLEKKHNGNTNKQNLNENKRIMSKQLCCHHRNTIFIEGLIVVFRFGLCDVIWCSRDLNFEVLSWS